MSYDDCVASNGSSPRLDRIERTIEFLVEQDARADVRQAKAEAQIAAIRKLVQTGMKMLVKLQEGQRRNEKLVAGLAASVADVTASVAELTASQSLTNAKLDALVKAMGRGRNGREH